NRRRVALCTDDRQPPDLLDEGGIDHMLRVLVESGLEPLEALRLATLNPADYFGLRDRGAVAPGRRADLVVVADLHAFAAEEVYVMGEPVARSGQALPWRLPPAPAPPPPSMRVDWDAVDLSIPVRGDNVRVIRVVADQIVTEALVTQPRVVDGHVVADPVRDLLKIAVLERHTGSGRAGLGLVHGIGLTEGALAGTVAHDHHNLIAVGVDDVSMLAALRAVAETGGGLAVARGADILAALTLPVGGLMSDRPIETIRRDLEAVLQAARSLGSPL
ncbi:MAG: adenine deaminase, partial [Gemmatimonadetes bacterium]|nr:adenine deaminase [Actinomycetota bacterium]NIU30635.1 adenine deaminase [Gemmatimonadota bacterium]NIU64442.1 adenine deaminase [Actinomycetota bacterium]NIV60994.1 amidohydrolase family protein [Gemmatimonadota bacterium]NIW26245.1 amidohydrolase family protein [Actinomycetota bacterium]